MRFVCIASALMFGGAAIVTAPITIAAEITLVREEAWPTIGGRPPDPQCNIRLQGEIGPEDLPKLRSATKRLQKKEYTNFYLCLDSNGGSFQQGLELA